MIIWIDQVVSMINSMNKRRMLSQLDVIYHSGYQYVVEEMVLKRDKGIASIC
jgi:hypothetical protein